MCFSLDYILRGVHVSYSYDEPLEALLGDYRKAILGNESPLKPLTVYVKLRKQRQVVYGVRVPHWLCYAVKIDNGMTYFVRETEKEPWYWQKVLVLPRGEHEINTWFFVCRDSEEYSVKDFVDVVVAVGSREYKERVEVEVVKR